MNGINKSIKTTKKNHIYVLMKRVGKVWRRVDMTLFVKRSIARQCVRELNDVQPLKNGKREVRYRVGRMEIVDPKATSVR
jgi:predicted Zn-ribbon and HTH transcriptional regulator